LRPNGRNFAEIYNVSRFTMVEAYADRWQLGAGSQFKAVCKRARAALAYQLRKMLAAIAIPSLHVDAHDPLDLSRIVRVADARE